MSGYALGMVYLVASVLAHQFETIVVKNYGKKYGKGGMFFNVFLCLFAVIYFVVSDLILDKSGFQLPLGVFLCGLVGAVLYAIGFYAAYVAFASGSFGLTRFYSSFGGVLTIIYGIAVLGETTGRFFYLAVALKFLALFLIQYKASKDSDAKFTLKWFISLMLNVLSNVAISILNKWQQDHFDGQYRNEYLTVIFIGSALVLFILGLIYEKDSFKSTVKHGFLYGMAAGLFNGMNNVFSLAVYYYLPISLSGPLKSGLAMLVTFVVAALMYKEKFTLRQYIGVAVGIAAVALINVK